METKKKTLAVVTGTRAEYGLLRPVIQCLTRRDNLNAALLVTGAHLAPEYGSTVREIEADGVPIAARIPILTGETGPLATAHAVCRALEGFAAWFEQNRPDGVLVLGDRYEIFAAAQAAAMQRVPVAHISGGDVTLGAADEYYRHCITKIAALHFPSCDEYAARVIRMGEAPETVYQLGGLGDENLRTLPTLSRAQLLENLGLTAWGEQPFALVTFHPETAGGADPVAQMQALLAAMDRTEGLHWLITKSNADAGGRDINALWDEWAAARPDKAAAFTSLGVVRYVSALRACALVAGNSSSGVVETPTFGVPTVNIGQRQAGRIVCGNVLCCPAEEAAIAGALATARSPEFAAKARTARSPYNGGPTSLRMARVLEAWLNSPTLGVPKRFYDGPMPEHWKNPAEPAEEQKQA